MFEEKNKKTLSFQISIAVLLSGILFYLIQELVYAMAKTSYNVFVVLADFIGIFAIIALILWIFLPKFQDLIKNIGIILCLSYVFLFLFGHLLAPRSLGVGGNVLEQFSFLNLSFIGLLILFFFTIGLLVIFGMRFTKKEDFAIYEKFVIILWLVTLGIFSSIHWFTIRVNTTFDGFVNLGITFLPRNLELIYALFGAVLLIISFFVGINKKILNLLTLLFINIIAFTLVIGTIGQIGFDFSDRLHTPYIMGNFLIIFGTIALAVCTFFVLQMKYPKSLAKSS
ncbi:MAG: hypothetical protein KGD59_10845 [Candidatus Heimdallarchaeota archaeon]|nr:hypothetical protein [Candidatus Heimdallarchaeota archaeon]MBY8995037.1 hypothetical protein [Candidatus Heimdallarchaeota archaeon]